MTYTAWKDVPLKYLSDEWCDGPFGSGLASDHYRNEGARVLRLQNIKSLEFDGRDEAFIDLNYFYSSLSRHAVEQGDLLIAGLGDDNNLVGRACVAPEGLGPALVKADCFRFRVNRDKADPRFVSYSLCASAAAAGGELASGSTRQRINLSSMAGRKVRLPSLAEQRRIANFLDKQTARIDALIAEKDRLLRALTEWHASELTRHCFGSDQPQVETGNPWMPSLPNGWKPMRLKHLISGIEQGWSPECEARVAEAEEWGVLKAGAANGGVYRETEHKALPSNLEPIPALEVAPGDVLITRASGTADYVGSFAFVYQTRSMLMLSDKNFRLRFNTTPRVLPELLAWSANTYAVRQQILQYVSGADGLAKNIGSGSLREVWFPMAPAQEQSEIISRLRKARENAVSMERHLVEHIDRLHEFRSSLISAAVTGQLDLSTFELKEAA